ncbi:hypothetical protein GCM10027598_14970 [Amycolatopsis oliviviridis]|uniref:Uncharacterized protein n=1 Tax=Amycolatopsis oliviviridis TaxID=1471590 RepID=A0ABQ3LZI5_9PSEU|nr:hypothetical protein GCM10017790_51170 [Amycolatopsis oliviviridis]
MGRTVYPARPLARRGIRPGREHGGGRGCVSVQITGVISMDTFEVKELLAGSVNGPDGLAAHVKIIPREVKSLCSKHFPAGRDI